MPSSKVREVFQRGSDAFNAHDVDAFAGTMADDVEVHGSGNADFRGKQAAKGFYKSWIDAFPDAHTTVKAAHILDDVAIEEGVFSGTHRGALKTPEGDIPATGRSVNVEYVQVLRYRGDKCVSAHLVYDRAELLEQLGLAPSVLAGAAAGRGVGPGQQPVQPH